MYIPSHVPTPIGSYTPIPDPPEDEEDSIGCINRHTGEIVQSANDGYWGRDFNAARAEMMDRQRGCLNEYYTTLRDGRPIGLEVFCIWEDVAVRKYLLRMCFARCFLYTSAYLSVCRKRPSNRPNGEGLARRSLMYYLSSTSSAAFPISSKSTAMELFLIEDEFIHTCQS